jgi:hypothetical protein
MERLYYTQGVFDVVDLGFYMRVFISPRRVSNDLGLVL